MSFRYKTSETQYGSSQIPQGCRAVGALLFLDRQYILTYQQLHGVQVQGWVGSGMCVLEDASQAWWLVGGKFSPLQCSLSTRHIL